jgi:hypothetical protein
MRNCNVAAAGCGSKGYLLTFFHANERPPRRTKARLHTLSSAMQMYVWVTSILERLNKQMKKPTGNAEYSGLQIEIPQQK